MIDADPIRERFDILSPHLDERERRLLAAVEARASGYGGIAAVSLATGLAASTIGRGLKDLADEAAGLAPGRVRRARGADHAAGLSQKSGGGAVRRTRPFCIPCQGLTN